MLGYWVSILVYCILLPELKAVLATTSRKGSAVLSDQCLLNSDSDTEDSVDN
jgi:hypothetical protein